MSAPPMPLHVSEFAEFFEQVHGYPPFGWQTELVDRVSSGEGWPSLIDLPTGAGKTTTIDIALFHLALDAKNPPAERSAPRRIVTVVDRRVVVDQATEHAAKIATALDNAQADSVAGRVRSALTSLHDEKISLHYAALRGGIVRDERWARSPDVAAVLSSTVDQIGSRLLFRGYGISWRSAPIHAGLLGNDTLVLLDEVHLSVPFSQTLSRLTDLMSDHRRPLQVVELSATPGKGLEAGQRRFPAEALGVDNVGTVLRQRLLATKPCDLEAVAVPSNRVKADEKLSKVAAEHAMRLADLDRTGLIGVIVNRVDTARRTFKNLLAKGYHTTLLTGRMRPLDRDDVVSDNSEYWTSREARDGTRIVVATQCIEAGADFDFDAIVTESAAIDALRQRFGRVDRRGIVHSTGEPIRSVILNRGEDAEFEDPVYGPALGNTWAWLCQLARVDFGISQLPAAPIDCYTTKPNAPLFTTQHLDFLSQTSLRPKQDLDIGPWLHGLSDTSPTVAVVWRDDLIDLVDANGFFSLGDSPTRQATRSEAAARLAFAPPVATESIDLPLHIAKQWLDAGFRPRHGIDALADVEAQPFAESESGSQPSGSVLVYRSGARSESKRVELRVPSELEPGDTVVLPSTFGGIDPDQRGWDPDHNGPVRDLCRPATRLARGRDVVRFGPWLMPAVPDDAGAVEDAHDEDDDSEHVALSDRAARRLPDAVYTALRESSVSEPITSPNELIDQLSELGLEDLDPQDGLGGIAAATRSWRLLVTTDQIGESPEASGTEEYPSLLYLAVTAPFSTAEQGSGPSDLDDAESDSPSFTGVEHPVLLRDHLTAVGELARRFAVNLGLPRAIVEDLGLAGDRHDVGKADHRFQRWLAPGAEYNPETVLAKSRHTSRNRAHMERSRVAAGYPKGARHELLSVQMVAEQIMGAATDPNLTLHLIASHHGHCRPFPPTYEDQASLAITFRHDDVCFEGNTSDAVSLVEVGSGIAGRFLELNAELGPHQLAYYEAILRLADHRRSEAEMSGQLARGEEARNG